MRNILLIGCGFLLLSIAVQGQGEVEMISFKGKVVDSESAECIPCRIYIQGEDGTWHFPNSASPGGSAIPYKVQRGPNSFEYHTTLSAHPFTVDLKPGTYTFRVERGKEYFTETTEIDLLSNSSERTFQLKRWIDMADRGWFSGDTHVHRTLEDLPNVMMAEDVNVGLPLLYWVTEAFTPPAQGRGSVRKKIEAEVISLDSTHVIYPLNTEYEIFTVDGKGHTLGAFFILNHKSIFEKGVPPVKPIAEKADKEGALLELDKHAWPWSMMLVPVMDIDLYELANNHLWQTQFGFPQFGESPADYMNVETDENGLTEWGWIDYGFKNYYALLNTGFRIRPTAGTANGVHPVPLGFGRVYVYLDNGFDYDKWMEGLDAGRSFVTTGPMLFVEVNGEKPGHLFKQETADPPRFHLSGSAVSAHPLDRIEIVLDGMIIESLQPENRENEKGAFENSFETEFAVYTSSWAAVRCFEERPDGRIRFAHTAPFHVELPGHPARARRPEVEYLVRRVQEQIDRNKGVLPEEALDEYRAALGVYKDMARGPR